jgi:hypothetical protein
MRNWKKILLGMAASTLMIGAAANAAPLVNLSILGSTSQTGSYSSSLSNLTNGETIWVEVVGQLAPVGTVDGTHTITSLNTATDGISALSFGLTGTAGTVFDTAALASSMSQVPTTGTNTTGGAAINWASGSGSSAGTIANNQVTGIRPTISGTDAGTVVTSDVIWEGSLTIENGTTTVTGAWGSTTGGFKYNGGTSAIISTSTEGGSTPYVGYSTLTLNEAESSPVPAPSVLGGFAAVLAIMGVFGAARRRGGRIA